MSAADNLTLLAMQLVRDLRAELAHQGVVPAPLDRRCHELLGRPRTTHPRAEVLRGACLLGTTHGEHRGLHPQHPSCSHWVPCRSVR